MKSICFKCLNTKIIRIAYHCWLLLLIGGILYFLGVVMIFDTFRVPTDSMMPTILPGDRGIINKLKLGGRLFNVFAAAEGKVVSIKRLPGYGSLERGDIIVFNATFVESWDSIALNMYKYFCKRAIAVAGDTIEASNGIYNVSSYDGIPGIREKQVELQKFIDDFRKYHVGEELPEWTRIFPSIDSLSWNIMDFGPMVVPGKGMILALDRMNTKIYGKYIAWETGQTVVWTKSGAIIGNQPAAEYTFKEDYCFAAGDNAINSQDSRYWGLVPVKFIVGVKL